MKKSVLLTISVVMAISGSAFAKGAAEVRERVKAFDKQGQELLKDANKGAGLRENAIKEVASKSGANDAELRTAFARDLSVNGEKVDLASQAQSIIDIKRALDEIKQQGGLDKDAQDLISQKERALSVAPQFLALAARISKGPAKQKQIDAFAKQLSLVREMLITMDAAELKSHLDVLEMAVDSAKKNPEINGDDAYAEALKAKFGDKFSQKLDEILNCARG